MKRVFVLALLALTLVSGMSATVSPTLAGPTQCKGNACK
jgi:hypothetical protein